MNSNTVLRTCTVCKQTKPRNTAFSRKPINQHPSDANGVRTVIYSDECKACKAEIKAELIKATDEERQKKLNERRARWVDKNRDRVNMLARARRAKAKEPPPRISDSSNPWENLGSTERPQW